MPSPLGRQCRHGLQRHTGVRPRPPDTDWLGHHPPGQSSSTYTDPTTGDDANAIQDTAGNDAATFTTGMDGVPAVTNNTITVNTPATGAPTITGTAQVGQTLTAGTTGIMDADGLTSVSYTYQWIRVPTDNTEAIISEATASTHTLVAADLGTTIKVTVSFTDDASNPETLTSAATAAVSAANTPPSASDGTVTTNEDSAHTFTASEFNFSDDRWRHVIKRKDCYASGFGHGDPGALGHACDCKPGGRGDKHRHSDLHPARQRERDGLREFHLQGQRWHGRERGGLHDDHHRDGGERRPDGGDRDSGPAGDRAGTAFSYAFRIPHSPTRTATR